MNDRERLEQLRGLLDRIERMPASADRDWMLRAVRARTVDVETGVKPAALRALPQGEADAEIAAALASPVAAAACRKPTRVTPARRATERAAVRAPRARRALPISRPSLPAVQERAGDESAVDLLGQGGVLCLGDPPAAAATGNRPWSAGLRG